MMRVVFALCCACDNHRHRQVAQMDVHVIQAATIREVRESMAIAWRQRSRQQKGGGRTKQRDLKGDVARWVDRWRAQKAQQ